MNRLSVSLPLAAALCSLLAAALATSGAALAHGNPQITVSPNPAAAGSKITVKGTGFDENEGISLVLEGVTGEAILGEALTDDNGDFHFETDLPTSAGAGPYRVRAESSDATALADLSVTAGAGAAQPPAAHEKSVGFHNTGSTSEVIIVSIMLAILAVAGLGLLFWRERPPA